MWRLPMWWCPCQLPSNLLAHLNAAVDALVAFFPMQAHLKGGPWEFFHPPCSTHGQANKVISASEVWAWMETQFCQGSPCWRPCPSKRCWVYDGDSKCGIHGASLPDRPEASMPHLYTVECSPFRLLDLHFSVHSQFVVWPHPVWQPG